MQAFAALYAALDAHTGTADKVALLAQWLGRAEPADAAWAVYFLAGGKPQQRVPPSVLRAAACAEAGIPEWLFEASYQAAGDLAETIAQVLPPAVARSPLGLDGWMRERVLPLRGLPAAEQQARLVAAWRELDSLGRFLLVKLIGGGFRVGVSRLLVQRALAQLTGLEAAHVAQRLVGWTDGRRWPDADRWLALVAPPAAGQPAPGQPYPFFLAHALEGEPARLGPARDWLAEWKFDGIRAQIVRRESGVWIWSRGEELVTERFPEVAAAALAQLPDGTVLDGELLVWLPGSPRPAAFVQLQARLNRKTLPKALRQGSPVVFVAYDLLEAHGADCRDQAQWQRRARLEALLGDAAAAPEAEAAAPKPPVVSPKPQAAPLRGQVLGLSPLVPPTAEADLGDAEAWACWADARARSREMGVEGLMLKHRDARYGSGRSKATGLWCKWKIAPQAVDAVLVYAQAGHGRRAGLYTDYTFAVWSRAPQSEEEAAAAVQAIASQGRAASPPPIAAGALQLLPFAKAYSGLSDEEFRAVDRVIRATVLAKFGPVRSVRPTLVFEIGFEGIGPSPRHKSGVAVRFPRMLRLRPDKPLHEADTLQHLQALAGAVPSGPT